MLMLLLNLSIFTYKIGGLTLISNCYYLTLCNNSGYDFKL